VVGEEKNVAEQKGLAEQGVGEEKGVVAPPTAKRWQQRKLEAVAKRKKEEEAQKDTGEKDVGQKATEDSEKDGEENKLVSISTNMHQLRHTFKFKLGVLAEDVKAAIVSKMVELKRRGQWEVSRLELFYHGQGWIPIDNHFSFQQDADLLFYLTSPRLVSNMRKARAEAAGQEVEKHATGDIPTFTESEQPQVQQLLLDLESRAIKDDIELQTVMKFMSYYSLHQKSKKARMEVKSGLELLNERVEEFKKLKAQAPSASSTPTPPSTAPASAGSSTSAPPSTAPASAGSSTTPVSSVEDGDAELQKLRRRAHALHQKRLWAKTKHPEQLADIAEELLQVNEAIQQAQRQARQGLLLRQQPQAFAAMSSFAKARDHMTAAFETVVALHSELANHDA
jgi:hypothetical protein